jgi:hypothetical protein
MNYAKWAVACLLLAIGGKLTAAECGPTVKMDEVTGVLSDLRGARANLLGHIKSLGSEVQEQTGQAHYRTSREFDRTTFVDQNAAALEHSLVLVLVLGNLRDGMFDHRDRQRVEDSLSVAAAMANDYSVQVQQAANKTLATIGRPGIAVDMAKTRDVVERSAALFAGCTIPR